MSGTPIIASGGSLAVIILLPALFAVIPQKVTETSGISESLEFGVQKPPQEEREIGTLCQQGNANVLSEGY